MMDSNIKIVLNPNHIEGGEGGGERRDVPGIFCFMTF